MRPPLGVGKRDGAQRKIPKRGELAGSSGIHVALTVGPIAFLQLDARARRLRAV